MYSDIVRDGDEEFVLNNLCKAARDEMILLFGEHFKNEISCRLKSVEYKASIRLKNNDETVGIFGIIEVEKGIGGIYFLSTDNLKNGSIISLLRGSRKQVDLWMNNFSLILDTCFAENTTVIKWLKFLGFSKISADGVFDVYGNGNKLMINRIFTND